MKELVATAIAEKVRSGDIIGIGTGTTADLAIQAIATRVKNEKLDITCIPTSYQTAWQCQELGLTVMYPGYRGMAHWGFDGADEVDDRLRMIKGKGAAMLKEKILAARCEKYFVIVDESKMVTKLGEKFPIPVEVVPEATWLVEKQLQKLGCLEVVIRQAVGKHGPIITEAGNVVLDSRFGEIPDALDRAIKAIPGVVEHGLFFGYAHEVLIGGSTGVRKLTR